MRDRILIGAALGLTLVAGCTPSTDRIGGDAAPAGSPSASASPVPSASSVAVTGSPAPSESANGTARPTASATRARGSGAPPTGIRGTDWRNVVISGLAFCGESDTVRFRNGSNGLDVPCTILPRGAQPVYAEFVVEEPAIAPSTEDALVLVELGNPGAWRRQALVPVQLSYNGRDRYARPVIRGDAPSGGKVMTFTSYRVVGQDVEATVRRLDGGTETRRWRKVDFDGNWERV
ncbi:hypothetical protein ACLQ26_22970 [Micromonospora sp. DT43]|uniref:hypothetical protein n=1 Tax=Micromonospora sp. DT43 TaxID=3393440 RepID=UPI003CEBF1C4